MSAIHEFMNTLYNIVMISTNMFFGYTAMVVNPIPPAPGWRLAELNQRLETRKYLFGDRLTQSDVRLFVSLVRFDIVYYYQNKLSAKRLIDFVNLWEYAKRLYQIPAFKQNTDFDAIFDHFYRIDESEVETFERVVPFGIDLAKWEEA